jgi:hypothetical protein
LNIFFTTGELQGFVRLGSKEFLVKLKREERVAKRFRFVACLFPSVREVRKSRISSGLRELISSLL